MSVAAMVVHFFSLNSAPLGCAKHISILTVIKCRCPDALRDFPRVVCFSWECFGFSIYNYSFGLSIWELPLLGTHIWES
jgi:hypothetical protein